MCLLVTSGLDFDTLNYFALGLLFFVIITPFYGIIAIHDVPYEISKHRAIRIKTLYARPVGQAFLRSTSSGRSLATTLCLCLELGSV